MTPKEFRLKKGWTLLEMAQRFGLEGENPMRTYQRWETGERPVPLPVIAEFERLSRGRVRLRDWPQAQFSRIAS
jgi:transcriptional regulator with XRE-family HTH domain